MKTITRNLSTRKTRRCTKNKKLISLLPRVDPGVFLCPVSGDDDSLMRQGRILEEEEGEAIGKEGARPRAKKPGQNDDSLMRRARISPGISRHQTGFVLFRIVPYCSRHSELYKAQQNQGFARVFTCIVT